VKVQSYGLNKKLKLYSFYSKVFLNGNLNTIEAALKGESHLNSSVHSFSLY